MTFHDLGTLGTADVVPKKRLDLRINLPWEMFSLKFAGALTELSPNTIDILYEAIISQKQVKIKKEGEELERFFTRVEALLKESPRGLGAQENEADARIQQLMNLARGKRGIKFDESSVRPAGTVILKDRNDRGLVLPVLIEEHVKSRLTHSGEKMGEEEIAGVLTILNPSIRDRLWDIEVKLSEIGATSLSTDTFYIKDIQPLKSVQVDYSIKEMKFPKLLDVVELISTSGNPSEESHALKVGIENQVSFKISVKNVSNTKLTDLEIVKEIPQGFTNVQILNASHETSTFEENIIIWTITELDTTTEASLLIQMTAKIMTPETTLKSGAVTISYETPMAISGAGIANINAYSNNRFAIEHEELEEKPDTFNCQLVFFNTSEFIVHLVIVDVYNPQDESKIFVNITPQDTLYLPAGSEWVSHKWQYSAPEPNAEPRFRMKADFKVVTDLQVRTKGVIYLDDVLLPIVEYFGNASN